MAASPHRILIAGLGHAGLAHLKALEQTPGAEVVAGVDTEPGRGLTFRGLLLTPAGQAAPGE